MAVGDNSKKISSTLLRVSLLGGAHHGSVEDGPEDSQNLASGLTALAQAATADVSNHLRRAIPHAQTVRGEDDEHHHADSTADTAGAEACACANSGGSRVLVT